MIDDRVVVDVTPRVVVAIALARRQMSPTIFRAGGFRFYFYSREESRMHVHVQCADGEARFWLEPRIEPAQNLGLNRRQMRYVRELIEEHEDEIHDAWTRHFGR